MTDSRTYVSPKREAQAAANRDAILEAFADQLADPTCTALSPTDAAQRVGVSVRTVHNYFPDDDARIIALGEWLDRRIYPQAVAVAQGPEDLARYFRDIHANALRSPITRALAEYRSAVWNDVRQRRREERLNAIRRSVKEIGAPKRDTEDATAMLLVLAGADISWPMHDSYDLPLDRIPDRIAATVQLIVDDLKAKAAERR